MGYTDIVREMRVQASKNDERYRKVQEDRKVEMDQMKADCFIAMDRRRNRRIKKRDGFVLP